MKRLTALSLALTVFTSTAMAEVLAARTLRAGTILAPGDLRTTGSKDDAHAGDMIGLELRKAVYNGRPVVPSLLGPPTIVTRNSVVTMYFSAGVLGIRAEGRALQPGGLGETIDVMNLSSRLKVRATVTAPNQVEVR